jgi:hypothetical protein
MPNSTADAFQLAAKSRAGEVCQPDRFGKSTPVDAQIFSAELGGE